MVLPLLLCSVCVWALLFVLSAKSSAAVSAPADADESPVVVEDLRVCYPGAGLPCCRSKGLHLVAFLCRRSLFLFLLQYVFTIRFFSLILFAVEASVARRVIASGARRG